MHPLEARIRNAHGPYAVIPFLTAGFPNWQKFWQALSDLDRTDADIIEIGVPFSDPVADGPAVEEASRRALAAGVNLEKILNALRGLKNEGKLPKAPLVLMGYLNPFLQYAMQAAPGGKIKEAYDALALELAKAGIQGLIVPDLPFEEARSLREALASQNIALIALVGPNTSAGRMELYARESQGYIYVVSVLGITGERASIAPQIAETLRRARQAFSLPLALGFGLSRPEQLEILPPDLRPDAAVFGSSLLSHLDAGGSAAEFMARWR